MSLPSANSPALRASAGKRAAIWAVFSLWIASAGAVLLAMTKADCSPGGQTSESAAILTREAAGWQVQHWLPARHELTPWLVAALVRRKPRPGVDEVVHLSDTDGILSSQLARAGWKIVTEPMGAAGPDGPQLRIFRPDGMLAWSGGYRADELKSEGATMLDDVILLRVARGEAGPARVLVGCVAPLTATSKVTAKLFSWL